MSAKASCSYSSSCHAWRAVLWSLTQHLLRSLRSTSPSAEVMQNAGAGGSPLDFLARFAGPIAWLIAGLLLLFGGLPFGGAML